MEARWITTPAALLAALGLLVACGGDGDGGSAAADFQACLEEEGFEVEQEAVDPDDEDRITDEFAYSQGSGGGLKLGHATFYKEAGSAESLFNIKKSAGLSFEDELIGLNDTVVYDWPARDEEGFEAIEACL